jgi:hypothetical protein
MGERINPYQFRRNHLKGFSQRNPLVFACLGGFAMIMASLVRDGPNLADYLAMAETW